MLFFAVYALSLAAIARCNVIGLDFGSDSMKIGIVQPGMPLGTKTYSIHQLLSLISGMVCRDCNEPSIEAEDSNVYYILSR